MMSVVIEVVLGRVLSWLVSSCLRWICRLVLRVVWMIGGFCLVCWVCWCRCFVVSGVS